MPVNGRARSGLKTSQCSSPSLSASPGSPARPQIRQKIENKPLQEQLPVNQIKTEPVDYEFKPIVVASGINCSTPLQNGVFSGGSPLQATSSPQGVVQAVVLPTVGLVSTSCFFMNSLTGKSISIIQSCSWDVWRFRPKVLLCLTGNGFTHCSRLLMGLLQFM